MQAMKWRPRALQLILAAAGARVPTPQSAAQRPARCQRISVRADLDLARESGAALVRGQANLFWKSQSEGEKDHIVQPLRSSSGRARPGDAREIEGRSGRRRRR
jgi:hypothetical protein